MAAASNSTAGTSAGSSIMPNSQQTFSCNACSIRLESTQLQRLHMKEAWHIYNIKRRMASLPPISSQLFSTQIEAQTVSTIAADDSKDSNSDGSICTESRIDGEPKHEAEIAFSSSSHCIFCENKSSTLDQNILHMSSIHGLHIHNIAHLIDLGSFIDYLGVLVLRYHECLYCGHTKRTTQGIRQHMSAKGHCSINLDLDPALLDFWEVPCSDEGNGGADNDQTDSDHEETSRRSHNVISPHSEGLIRPGSTDEQYMSSIIDGQVTDDQRRRQRRLPFEDRRVSMRSGMGLLGVHEQQKRALRITEKKMLKQEVIARAQQRWTVERVANKQKHFRSDVPGRSNG
ncbi:C2H2 type zinc-finger-domain-containing protein [Delphinella strobiligena]|nr:C2H2 type zinc-finger-domain-containing protein [Delphinella strobiligena]